MKLYLKAILFTLFAFTIKPSYAQLSVNPSIKGLVMGSYTGLGLGTGLEYTIKKNQRRKYSLIKHSWGLEGSYYLSGPIANDNKVSAAANDGGNSILVPIKSTSSGFIVNFYWKSYLTEGDIRTPIRWYYLISVGYGLFTNKNSLDEYDSERYTPLFFEETTYQFGFVVPIGIGAEHTFNFGTLYSDLTVNFPSSREKEGEEHTQLDLGVIFNIGMKFNLTDH